MQARDEILQSEVPETINSIWSKKELSDQWKESVIVPVHNKDEKLTVVIILDYHCYQRHTKFYPISSSQV
jgi:hypothetical protein